MDLIEREVPELSVSFSSNVIEKIATYLLPQSPFETAMKDSLGPNLDRSLLTSTTGFIGRAWRRWPWAKSERASH